MIVRQWLKFTLCASLFLAGVALSSGCSQDAGQPARESISAHRSSSPGKTEDVKDKVAGAGKAGAEGKPLGGKKSL
jgi:hypothetical protein